MPVVSPLSKLQLHVKVTVHRLKEGVTYMTTILTELGVRLRVSNREVLLHQGFIQLNVFLHEQTEDEA